MYRCVSARKMRKLKNKKPCCQGWSESTPTLRQFLTAGWLWVNASHTASDPVKKSNSWEHLKYIKAWGPHRSGYMDEKETALQLTLTFILFGHVFLLLAIPENKCGVYVNKNTVPRTYSFKFKHHLEILWEVQIMMFAFYRVVPEESLVLFPLRFSHSAERKTCLELSWWHLPTTQKDGRVCQTTMGLECFSGGERYGKSPLRRRKNMKRQC